MRAAPIAIVGIGCRFPGGHGSAQLWQSLRDGRDLVADSPAQLVALAACAPEYVVSL